MNIGIVFYFLGWVLGIEGILMILPCVVALVYREPSGFYFLGVALFCGISGWLLANRKLKSTVFYAKEGFVAVSLSWIVLSFFGALPFFLSGEIPLLEDALFEVISGFTTTGASVLPDVEALSRWGCWSLSWLCFRWPADITFISCVQKARDHLWESWYRESAPQQRSCT